MTDLEKLATLVMSEYPPEDERYQMAERALNRPPPHASTEHLAMCDRGRRALALLYDLQKEVCGMDSGNLVATRSLVQDMTAGTHNGTILDLLRPYKTPNGQT